jgi:predicted homoserine dehydrogenase-like protein
MVLLQTGSINVAVEATGNPAIGLVHAREAIRNRLHIVMVNVEASRCCFFFGVGWAPSIQ